MMMITVPQGLLDTVKGPPNPWKSPIKIEIRIHFSKHENSLKNFRSLVFF